MGEKNGQPKGCNQTRVLYRCLEIVMCILPDAAISWPYALRSNVVSTPLATTKNLTGQLQYERRPSSHYVSFGKSTAFTKLLPPHFAPRFKLLALDESTQRATSRGYTIICLLL
jgi:hypothetical protein